MVQHHPDRPGVLPEADAGQLPDRRFRILAAGEPLE